MSKLSVVLPAYNEELDGWENLSGAGGSSYRSEDSL